MNKYLFIYFFKKKNPTSRDIIRFIPLDGFQYDFNFQNNASYYYMDKRKTVTDAHV